MSTPDTPYLTTNPLGAHRNGHVSAELADAIRRVVREFAIEGRCVGVKPHARGHIHDTFVSYWSQGGYTRRFLHQRMNRRVFKDIDVLMHNVATVTTHLKDKIGIGGRFRTLRLVRTREAANWLEDDSGPWRTYRYVENTVSFDLCPADAFAFEAAQAFGQFQQQLADLEPARLHETIPSFFSTTHRLAQFDAAVERDVRDRVATAAPEIRFVEQRREGARVFDDGMRDGRIPTRVVHGDTKLNNVLFDEHTGKARCVVDLDTCMPGWSLYDFGDLVRFTAARSTEDETDLAKAGMDLRLYRALVRGYVAGAGALLTAEERRLMPVAARIVTLTLGVRFLTDHLNGDVYFKVKRPNHNLDRARVQFRMVERMEQCKDRMAVAAD